MLGVALYWFLVLQVLSLISFPLAYRVFWRLPDRGWSLSKPLGLLLVGFGTWGIGLTHTIPNSRLTVLLAILVVAVLSWSATRHNRPELRAFLREHSNAIISTELLFAAVFFGFVLLRASITQIGHTEQPMDFMFLNSTVVSPFYPPNDPWLAGRVVSYYYLGYLMIGSVTMLSGVAVAVAFNLGLATMAAMAAVAAFGVTFNLVRLARGSVDGAVLGGLTAAFLLLIASNLAGTLELARASGSGDAAFWDSVGIGGLSAVEQPSINWSPDGTWWWWRASRVIPGAVTEFPMFSFILGDMHPHVMSIGFVLLSFALAIQIYLQPALLRRASLHRHWPLMLITVVSTGSLAAINLWDLPLGLVLISGALMLNAVRNERFLQFGSSIAMRGDTIVVGAPRDSDVLPWSGAAFVYKTQGNRWTRRAKLLAIDTHENAGFGTSVAFGGSLAVVGAPQAGREGAVYLFSGSETTGHDDQWSQQTTIRPPNQDGARRFGQAVAIDGDHIAVGSEETVYIFSQQGSGWTVDATLKPEGGMTGFGEMIAMDGGALAASAPYARGGEVWIYERASSGWEFVSTLKGEGADGFGRSLALRHRRLAVGAVGAAFIFHRPTSGWVGEAAFSSPEVSLSSSYGSSIAIDRWFMVVGANGSDGILSREGVGYLYSNDGTKWELGGRLASRDGGADGGFGSSVALDDATVVIGAPGDGHGAANVYHRTLDAWSLRSKLVGRWRFGRALFATTLMTGMSLLAVAPFLVTFESNASGILPLRGIQTRPLHLILVWSVSAFLVLPVLGLTLRRVFSKGNWNLTRMGVAGFIGFAPVFLWLQPVYSIPFYVTALLLNGAIIFLFGIHKAGYRLPKVDEMAFAVNSGVTRVAGTALLLTLLLWDGIAHGERGVNDQYLAVSRLLIVTPMAMVITLSIYGAWTLAHRDSESLRIGGPTGEQNTAANSFVPVLLVLAIASALIMGVELFRLVDVFGGDLRRFNTVFKLYYQAWILMAILGGFGLWYVGSRWDRRVLPGRMGMTAWAAVLLVAFGAVTYYPLAAVTSRAAERDGLSLDGQAHIELSYPDEFAAIAWIRGNLPRDAVVLESAVIPCGDNPNGCSAFTDAGRISSSTGRPTVLGWEQHEAQWRKPGTALGERREDVRTIYETTDPVKANALLAKYAADYVVLGPRERSAYGIGGGAKFADIGPVVFPESGTGSLLIYQVGR